MPSRDMDIAIVGGGPRGLAVLETLAIRLKAGEPADMIIAFIDDTEPGAGRIWRTRQPSNLLMNTLASQVTMFSQGNGETSEPGNGPSLYEWLIADGEARDDFYASRQVYGRYLKFVLECTVACLQDAGAVVEIIKDRVEDIDHLAGCFTLQFASSYQCRATQVVLCTGHDTYARDHSVVSAHLCANEHYIAGNSCADMPLDSIPGGSSVGLIGLGLGFHDIISTLTEARGGQFRRVLGELQYQASGHEPKIYAGSRTGLPIPGRAINQKVDYQHKAIFFSDDYLVPLLATAPKELDFFVHLLPLIVAEMEHIYYGKYVENIRGSTAARAFEQQHMTLRDPWQRFDDTLLSPYALGHIEPFDLERLKNPFTGRTYAVNADFNAECSVYLEQDLDSARAGNLTSPLKAALDVLRDIRDTLRDRVEFEGLSLASWQRFLAEFSGAASLLAAGPPIFRVEQLIALMKAGVVSLVGPGMVAEADGEQFRLSSPAVLKSTIQTQWLIDTRTPFPPLRQAASSLLGALRMRGMVRPYRYESGGVAIEQSTYQVSNNGLALRLFALGIPTEGPKWFTQVGSATPGKFSNFTREARQLVAALMPSPSAEVSR